MVEPPEKKQIADRWRLCPPAGMMARMLMATIGCEPGSSFSEGHRGATETMFIRYFLFVVLTLILAGRGAFAEDSDPVILKEDFEHGFSRWKTSDPDPAKSVW